MSKKGKCAACTLQSKDRICKNPSGKGPGFCSTKIYQEIINKTVEEYKKENIREFARQASIQEGEGYIDRKSQPHYPFPVKPRIQEIIEFCHKMKYKRLGLAFCDGLKKEAAVVAEILEKHGFEVISVICKVGGIEKEFLGIKNDQKVRINEYETMCNPIAQALVLNAAETDFNIILGLCVGHDSLFIKYSEAMVTVLAAKDRLLGHNPLAAIYLSDSYYKRFKMKDVKLKSVEVKNNEKI